MSDDPLSTSDKKTPAPVDATPGGQVSSVLSEATNFLREANTPIKLSVATLLALVAVSGIEALWISDDRLVTLTPNIVMLLISPHLVICILAGLAGWQLVKLEKIKASGKEGADTRAGAAREIFETLETIDDGGKTRVVKAFDTVLRRHVVKKILKNNENRDTFISGAQDAVKLSNFPNYIEIYSAKFTSEELPYLVMQHMKGGNLYKYINANSVDGLKLDVIRRIILKVGDAMQIAHQNKVPLGHIKPSHILLDENDDPYVSPRVRLDFLKPASLEKAIRERKLSPEDLIYTAPELTNSQGSDEIAPILSDQYTLGVLAYHLLTSSLPQTLKTVGITPDSKMVDETFKELQAHGQNAYQQLPDMHELNPGVPVQVSAIFKKMVSIDPYDRYDSLYIALRAIRSAAQLSLIGARDSYNRCLAKDGGKTFFEQFYAVFTSTDKIAEHFSKLNKKSWTAQQGKLQRAIDASFDFTKDYVVNRDYQEPNAMSGYAQQHVGLDLDKADYGLFVDALVLTACGSDDHPPFDPACEDTDRREEISGYWRDVMRPVVNYFTSK